MWSGAHGSTHDSGAREPGLILHPNRDEVVCSNNVLSKFIFFFRMPFVRKALFLYVLSNKRSFEKNTNFERNSNKKKSLINVRKFLFE